MSAQAAAARSLIRVGRYMDAVSLLGQALASEPDDFELHGLLAQAYLGLHQPAAALRAADAAMLRAPDDDWPHRLRSLALRGLGRTREAVAAAKEAVRLAPELAFARHTLAEAHLAAKQHDDAYVQALEAVRLSPDSADMHDLLGRSMLGKRMNKEAESSFRHALALDPNDAAAHNNLGVALTRTGRREQAVHEFNEAARLDPSFETARKNLYSGTRVLLGGGSVLVFLIYLLIRTSVVLNVTHRSAPLVVPAVLGFLLLGALLWVWRYRPFTRKRLPPTAIAYYKSETRRLRRENLPYDLLRVAGIALVIAMVIVALTLQLVWLLLFTIPVGAAWYWGAPRLWRRYGRRP